MKLTNNQKKYLRSMAHDLKPFVMIGQHGLSESVIDEIDSTISSGTRLSSLINLLASLSDKALTCPESFFP